MPILVFTATYKSATDTKPAYFSIRCMNTGQTRRASYDYGANHATRAALQQAFNWDADKFEFINHNDKGLRVSVWAINA
jgi:hypothetical protein